MNEGGNFEIEIPSENKSEKPFNKNKFDWYKIVMFSIIGGFIIPLVKSLFNNN
tara:strand:+ start:307 stop:465 length:159 start_codon:yes stop_codon:yes gene_type:complete